MNARRARLGIAVFTASLLLLLGAAGCRQHAADGPVPEGRLEIRGKSLPVELAESRAEQEKGLGERDALAWGTGMYFPYARPGFFTFWMKGMRFPIDIVYVREGRIVEIFPQVPFEKGGNGPTIRPSSLADGVIEVPAGYAAVSGWQVGDRVRLERLNRD
jgi:uncharacterized protein